MDALLQVWLMMFGLILARVSAFLVTVPYMGGKNVPMLVKNSAALALTCFWFSEAQVASLSEVIRISQQPWIGFVVAIARESLLGCALGFVFGLFVIPFRIGGEYVSQEMGLTMGTITNPTNPQSTTVIGDVIEMLGVMFFFSYDVHHIVIAALHSSFRRQPVGAATFGIPVAVQMDALASVTEWGLLLVAPIGCCLFITSLVLALMTRAAPQMNLMSIGYSLRLIVGMLACVLLWPDIAPQMTIVLQRFSGMLTGR